MSVNSYYWDANVFHAIFNAEAGRVAACSHMASMAEIGSVRLVTSALTFVECVRLQDQPRTLTPANEATIKKYFERPFIEVVNVTRRIGEDARQLLWAYQHLRYKDAIHVATAVFSEVDALLTYDEDDLIRLDGQINARGGKLRIIKPPEPPPPTPRTPELGLGA